MAALGKPLLWCSRRRCRRWRAMPAWPPAAWRRRSSGCGPSEGDIAIGGATLAAEAAALGLIDEYRAVVYPVLVGGGIPFFPQRERRVDLDLVETCTLVQESSTSLPRGAPTQTAARPAAKRGHAPAGRASPALELKEPEACCCLSCHRVECNTHVRSAAI